MMKRKNDGPSGARAPKVVRKDQTSPNKNDAPPAAYKTARLADCFSEHIFPSRVDYARAYRKSKPYKHCVVKDLVDPELLRDVRKEVEEHIVFTPKETDIYKIHQTGDLINLDGISDDSVQRLPALRKLRDCLYSPAFRTWIAAVADAGPVSGQKMDMAVNVYTPTCHLLCHDDVIGTRRISYILYLTDADKPWQEEWGGGLRLYPTEKLKSASGTEEMSPSAEHSLTIPPAFNQLSFFAVQPGESFHDVEEVYTRKAGEPEDDGGRVRMAISGWYHIPQDGELGYKPKLEQELAAKSSLAQLKSKSNKFDLPPSQWKDVIVPNLDSMKDGPFTAKEMDWLLRYISPSYLHPEFVADMTKRFEEESILLLKDFLRPQFAEQLKSYLKSQETSSSSLFPKLGKAQQRFTGIARPPHKHRYAYRQPCDDFKECEAVSPIDLLIEDFLPADLFARWLHIVTGLKLTQAQFLGRRFRKGKDYTLATTYDEPDPQLEACIGITPTSGWGFEGSETETEGNTVGGYEMYMVADEDQEIDLSGKPAIASATGAGIRRKIESDPAVYKSSTDDEDGGVLFTNPADFNTLALVLRDNGVMKFMKYVSESAPGDRWDVVGNYKVLLDDDDDDDDEEADAADDDEEDAEVVDDGDEEDDEDADAEGETEGE